MNPYDILPRMSRHVVQSGPSSLDAVDQAIGTYAFRAVDGADRIVRRVAERLRLWHARRRTLRALNALDDRALRDIGLDRSEITSVVEDVTASWTSASPFRPTVAERRLHLNRERHA